MHQHFVLNSTVYVIWVFMDNLFSTAMILISLVSMYFLQVAQKSRDSNIWKPKQLSPRIPFMLLWGIQFTKKLIEFLSIVKITLSCCTYSICWPK